MAQKKNMVVQITESVQGIVEAMKYKTTDEPYIPGQKVIKAVMKPIAGEDPYLPTITPYPSLVTPFEIDRRSCILDIETTGLYPWDSRIICIGVLDIATVAKQEDIGKNTIVFAAEDEAHTVNLFMDWFKRSKFTQIIGYNVSFDHRFIFAKCMKFAVQCAEFRYINIYDVMQVMEQVKREFVYGRNKAGSMGQWQEYLFGTVKQMDYAGILKAYKEGRIKDIVEYNRQDIKTTYDLWALIRFVSETHGRE